MLPVNYPVTLRIQVFSLSAKLEAVDALHQSVCSVRKQRLKFREHLTVFAGPPTRAPLCEIRSEPSPGFPVRYSFASPQGKPLGALARAGAVQPFTYVIQDETGKPAYEIAPKNPRARTVDHFLSGVPVIRLLSALLCRPVFEIRSLVSSELFSLRKLAAPLENRYVLKPAQDAQPPSLTLESLLLMSVVMTVFLEG